MQEAARLSRGLRGLWDRLTGKYARQRSQNEGESAVCVARDRAERVTVIHTQLNERRGLQRKLDWARQERSEKMLNLNQRMSRLLFVEAAQRADNPTADL